MQITFKPLTSNYYAEVCNLFKNEKDMFFALPNNKYPLTIKQLRVLKKHRSDLTIGLVDNKVVCFASLYSIMDNSAVINGLFVKNDYRGLRVGKKLLQEMIKICREKYDVYHPKLAVFFKNTKALKLFQSCNFIAFEEGVKKYQFRGDVYTIIWLEYKGD